MGITFEQPKLSRNQRNGNAVFRVTLRVPYEEKEEVKKLGARWDTEKKTWFVMIGPTRSINSFIKWIASPVLC